MQNYEKTEARSQAFVGLYHDDKTSDAQIGLNTQFFGFFKQVFKTLLNK
jgi:hypothetical protein